MKFLRMTNQWINAVMVVIALMFAIPVHATTPSNWKDTGFSINASGMKLRDVLNEFGITYGVRIASSIKDQMTLKGRLKAENGTEFLDRLMHTYDFRWFVYAGTLYVVPRNDNASVRLEVGEDGVQDAKAALVGVGLFDSRFGWGELPDEGIVIVNGPREYVNLVREILVPETKKQTFKGKQVMVFRLKYANATDRVINIRGQKETIPGVKTILSGLLSQDGFDKASDGTDKSDSVIGKRGRINKNQNGSSREMGGVARTLGGRADEDQSEDTSRNSKSKVSAPRETKARIDADSALNALIIYDNANKREMYQALIAELDVEPQQIEIEALIVDIDRSKLTDLGVEWSFTSGNTVTTVNGTAGSSSGIELPLPGSTMLISNAARFYARLKAMESKGDAHVLAKPTVLTLDNVAAVLDLSQTTYVPLVGERVSDLASITAGTMLRVVPRVVREGASTRVRLEVDIEDGALGDGGVKGNVTRSTISTQAIVDMQQTLMIGGYHSESKTRNQQKVPLLGDIPLFGGLFRNSSESMSTRERLFMITPRLSGTTGVNASARSKAARLARSVALADKDNGLSIKEKSSSQLKKTDALPDTVPPLPPGAPSLLPPSPPTSTPPSTPPSSVVPTVGVPLSQTTELGLAPRVAMSDPHGLSSKRLKCSKPKYLFDSVGAARLQ